ncbi:amino acid ABC transporter substrate-binding protein (PAAT family) [Nocardioides albertanoniae]|uniref:Amino acid ABC transporter substrate-binding protein (PAAT family) n=1 Tax=Nocardioides albertanoniae TaxID=1175486 RepID=A0A543ACM0_9ACTN|nr:glutamate ABC transporter substrate-binding protein [Nocardioides albertanoniae]TQL70332.1 amino acid ABC transporter substrate-binding protein (PAAT family) [Nocardioides albertanoniae]
MKFKKIAAVVGALALAGSLAACGGSDSGSDAGGDKIKIGIKYDQPGLGFKKADGTYAGFDVDMAKYIAKGLGYDEDQIQWEEAVSANRETFLKDGSVDMILATYSITDERKAEVDFAGPYYVAGQDLLIRADDSSIKGPEDMKGKKICSVTGSTSAQTVKDKYGAVPQEFDSYSKCITALQGGQIDALTTDDIILAGYAEEFPDEFKIVGQPFTEENYGVGLPKGSKDRDKINDLIEKSFEDGAWEKAFNDNLGKSGYELPAPPKVDRY